MTKVATGMLMAGAGKAQAEGAVASCTNKVACGPAYTGGEIPVVVPTGGGGSDDDKSQSTDWTKSLSKYAPLVFVASFALSTAVTAFKDYLRKDEKKKEAAEKANALINSPDFEKYLTIETISEGNGKDFPTPGELVTVHYIGTLEDGSKFDSSRDRGQPFKFPIGVGRVIKGWDAGVMKLSKGARAKLTIQPQWAYGARGSGPIPPDSVLCFDVELLDC
jgi:FK506-binding protein 1